MLRCPTCAETYPPGTRFCRLDGAALIGAMAGPDRVPAANLSPDDGLVCPTCGATYPTGVNFCRTDGTPLVAPAPAIRPRVQPLTVRQIGPTPLSSPPPSEVSRRAAAPAGTALDALVLLLGASEPPPLPRAPAEPPASESEPPASEALEP